MKLYLSSIGAPDMEALYGLLGKRSGIKAASIRTAWDPYSDTKRAEWAEKAQQLFERMHGEAEVIDLKKYAQRSAELQKKLEPFDLVWMHGGNSFYLSYWAAQCGLNDVMVALLDQGIIYAGDSAGAVLAGPSLHGVEFADNPDDAPETVFEGLSLVDFVIIPHWGNEEFQEVLEKVKTEAEKYTDKIVTLGDQECITVDGDVMVMKTRSPGRS